MVAPVKILAMAAALSSLSTTAAAQTSSCLSEAEAQSIFTFAVPEMVSSVVSKCSPVLPASAFLRSSGPATVARFKAQAAPRWPAAKQAFMKTLGDDKDAQKLFNAMPDDAVRSLMSAAMQTAATDDLKPEKCRNIDKLAASPAPLSIDQLANALIATMQITEGESKGSIEICPAS